MSIETLCETIPLLKQTHEQSSRDRNYAQTERDTVERMAMATKDHLRTLEAQVKLLSLGMESADKEHQSACENFKHKVQMLELGQVERLKIVTEAEKTLQLNQIARHRVKVEGKLYKKSALAEEADDQKAEKCSQIQRQLEKHTAYTIELTSKGKVLLDQLQIDLDKRLQEVCTI